MEMKIWHQVYAVEALVRQATLTNRNAYVWHTTGAGKTLTSFKTAQILAANQNIKKVIFLVDRKDLDSQTTEEFNKFENGSVDATDRTDVLVKQIQRIGQPTCGLWKILVSMSMANSPRRVRQTLHSCSTWFITWMKTVELSCCCLTAFCSVERLKR